MGIYLEGKCPDCGAIVGAAIKIKELKRSDWEGMVSDFLEQGMSVRQVKEPPEISIYGCKEDCISRKKSK